MMADTETTQEVAGVSKLPVQAGRKFSFIFLFHFYFYHTYVT